MARLRFYGLLIGLGAAAACGSCAAPAATALPATALPPPASTPDRVPTITPTTAPAPGMSHLAPPAWTALPLDEFKVGGLDVSLQTWWAASPDGKWIARGMREQFFPACVYLTSLTVMSSDGAVKWVVWDDRQNCGLGSTNPRPLHWSRDGKHLFFTNEPITDGCAPFVNGSDLYRVDLASGQAEQLLPAVGSSISLSPDEIRLAYMAYGGRGLVQGDWMERSEIELGLFQQGEAVGHIVWEPDLGMSLMVTVAPDGPCDPAYSIARVDLQTLSQTPLIVRDPRSLETVAWPEPDRVLLRSRDGGYWWMDSETGGLQPASAP